MADDIHLLHMAINSNINLLTCEQMTLLNCLETIRNYQFNSKYRLDGLLEASLMFKCVQRETNQEFTMKIISANEFENFISIYLYTSDISDGISKIVDIIHEKRFVFVIFESAFDDLHSFLRSYYDQLDIHTIFHLFKQMVQIVDRLHQRDIILNDIKLRKFVFSDPFRKFLKLENLDKSIKSTRIENDDDHRSRIVNYGCIHYVAPEKLVDSIDRSSFDAKRSDIYSLGVILYTLLMGRYPFHDSDLDKLKDQILNYSTIELPQIEKPLKKLILSLLAKNPLDRPLTSELLENELLNGNLQNKNSIDLKALNHEEDNSKKNSIISSNSSSKEYFSKLIKLIKLTKLSIEMSDQASCKSDIKSDTRIENGQSNVQLDTKFETKFNFNNVPIVHYRLNELNKQQIKQNKKHN